MFPTESLLQPTLAPVPVALPPVSTAPTPATETIGVLHVINGEHYAGAERVQDLLAKRLPEFGFQPGFACVKPDVFEAMRESQDAPLWNLPMWGKFDLRIGWKVADVVRQHGYRLLHAHTVRTAMIGGIAAAAAGVPLVYHAHSPTVRNNTGGWQDRMKAVVERLCLRRVAHVIAVSEAMAEYVAAAGFDRSRITVVSNGVPRLASLPPKPRPTSCWTLGTVALFRPRKGIEVLLEALAILRQHGLPVRLRAVGGFESHRYEAELAARIRELELSRHVAWTGFTRDVTAELQRMDLLVLPSLFGEGLPMVVLEAMASGVPVVATRVDGVPEAIRNGCDGVLTSPGDAKQLAQGIADVIRGRYDWSAMRTSAWSRQGRLFSDRSMAAGAAAVYNQLLAAEYPGR
ncbi:MAG: glycosyltransferase family 4 protein [Planctomycetaceae bacterium]|nr:glycosyltransferase family 4 protein [Planctomycetaceae bacterium]